MLKKQSDEGKKGQSSQLYEYMVLRNVIDLVNNATVWGHIAHLFTVTKSEVLDFLDTLQDPRNRSAHVRSGLTPDTVLSMIEDVRYFAQLWEDDWLLDVADNAEAYFYLTQQRSTLH